MIVQGHKEYGAGQPLVVLQGEALGTVSRSLLREITTSGVLGHKIVVLNIADFGSDSDKAAVDVLSYLDGIGIRAATILGVGEVGTVAIAFTLAEKKRVRRLILVDTPVRPKSTWRENLIRWCEDKLPLGLPFRKDSDGFDARSYLQRIRCPTLVVTTPDAGQDLQAQAEHESRALATAWFDFVANTDRFKALLTDFLEVPAKRPQKNRDFTKASA
jgi:pimeloyl-ACP methyl ester carboxylesterase